MLNNVQCCVADVSVISLLIVAILAELLVKCMMRTSRKAVVSSVLQYTFQSEYCVFQLKISLSLQRVLAHKNDDLLAKCCFHYQ